MIDTDTKRTKLVAAMSTDRKSQESWLDAGFTYFGQFIAHDIVPPTHRNKRINPASQCNFERDYIAPFLNLDSLYGNWPFDPKLFNADGTFRTRGPQPGIPEDLFRANGIACIPESRNDENTIVSQLHLLLQRFHNSLVDRNAAANIDDARRLVTLVFQIVTIEDYLFRLLDSRVHQRVFEHAERPLDFHRHRLPPEFSHAAFRFGHSMVRENYELSGLGSNTTSTTKLFVRSKPLSADLEINWRGFFGWSEKSEVQKAMQIDARIARAMTILPTGDNIVDLNLLAAECLRLPSGIGYIRNRVPKHVKTAFRLGELRSIGRLKTLMKGPNDYTILDLPLWPYILIEAYRDTSLSDSDPRGSRLGVLASLICAEVLANSMAHASNSAFDDGIYDFDKALGELGGLGQRLQSQKNNRCSEDEGESPRLSMRHLIEFIDDK